MLTRNDVLTITEPIETMYADCQAQLLINISKHFAGGYLPTAEWEAKMLSEMGALTQESVEIIAANTGQAPEAIKKAITEGMGIEVADAEKVLKGAAKAGKIQGATESWQASPRVQSVVGSLTEQAKEDFNVVNTVMLESTRNRYAASIQYCRDEESKLIEKLMSVNNAQELEGQLSKVQRSLNASTASVAIGAEARQAAVRRTIKQLADQGITGYIDAGGHHWSPEAYINMDIRTTVHNAAIQGQQARSADYGVSTFQISSHAGARPLCEPYQGKFYSWDGSSGVVEDYNGKEYAYESIYDTTYEQPAGIFGINCGHSPQTFVSGYSIPRYEPTQDFDKNAEEYALSQRQRYMEREIRKSKTEALCHEASGDKEAFEKTAAKIKQQNANYKAFCSENGRTPRMDRTQVYGYNRSVSGKATQAIRANNDLPFNVADNNAVGTNILGAVYDSHIDRNNLKAVAFADVNKLSNIVYADYGKLPQAVGEVYNNTIQKYAYQYDTPLSSVRLMTKNEFLNKRNAAAFCRHTYENDTCQMVINPKYNGSIDEIKSKVAAMGKRHYAVQVSEKDMPSYYATHEFGHSILNVTQPLPRNNYIGLDTARITQARQEIIPIWEEYKERVAPLEAAYQKAELDIITGATMDKAVYNTTKDALNATRISKVSMDDIDEFVAESFVNVKIGITQNSYADRVVAVLDKYFGK